MVDEFTKKENRFKTIRDVTNGLISKNLTVAELTPIPDVLFGKLWHKLSIFELTRLFLAKSGYRLEIYENPEGFPKAKPADLWLSTPIPCVWLYVNDLSQSGEIQLMYFLLYKAVPRLLTDVTQKESPLFTIGCNREIRTECQSRDNHDDVNMIDILYQNLYHLCYLMNSERCKK